MIFLKLECVSPYLKEFGSKIDLDFPVVNELHARVLFKNFDELHFLTGHILSCHVY